MVSPAVAATLPPGETFGLWYYNRRDVRRYKERGADGKYYERWRTKERARKEWLAVPIPNAGVPLEDVLAARERLRASARPSKAGGRFWELSGGILRCAECGGAMRARAVAGRTKDAATRYYYLCSKAFSRAGCEHRTNYRAGALEREVMTLVDDVLSDPGRITREVDEAIRREEERLRNPDAEGKVWGDKLAEVARKRAAFQDQQAAGLMTLSELSEKLARLDEERSVAERELGRVREVQGRIQELMEERRAVLEMFGTGFALGLVWFPPSIRRGVYDLLRLRVVVQPSAHPRAFANPRVTIEGDLDRNVVACTEEVERYVAALREADRRIQEEETSLAEEGHVEQMARVEEELGRVLRESTGRRDATA